MPRKEIKPDEIVDIATLTGACSSRWAGVAGLCRNHAALGDAGDRGRAGERASACGRSRCIDEYREGLKSDVADLRNTGRASAAPSPPGCSSASSPADTPWVHLDIAGIAFTDKELPLAAKGGVGFGGPYPHRVRARGRRRGG